MSFLGWTCRCICGEYTIPQTYCSAPPSNSKCLNCGRLVLVNELFDGEVMLTGEVVINFKRYFCECGNSWNSPIFSRDGVSTCVFRGTDLMLCLVCFRNVHPGEKVR